MIDYPRFPISEAHLRKFPDSMEFQSWKVNFRTEVGSKTVDPHLTLQWIKEVQTAKSIDDLITSRSIVGRTDFTDYDMLDAMIASALKKLLDKHVHFRKRFSVEEQRAQKYGRFSRGRQIACMIYEHIRATGSYDSVQGVSDLFKKQRLQNDDVQDFHVPWDKHYYQQVKHLQKWSWEDCTSQNCRILMSFRPCWLGTIKKLYETKDHRAIRELKTAVRLHLDQAMRARNCRARYEIVERGMVTKSQKKKEEQTQI